MSKYIIDEDEYNILSDRIKVNPDNITRQEISSYFDIFSKIINNSSPRDNQGEGPMGPVGPKGLTGSRGETGGLGPQGYQGFEGPQGYQGSTGSQGETGAQGATGAGVSIKIIDVRPTERTFDQWEGSYLLNVENWNEEIPIVIYPPTSNEGIITIKLQNKSQSFLKISLKNPDYTTFIDSVILERTFLYQNQTWKQINNNQYNSFYPNAKDLFFSLTNNSSNSIGHSISLNYNGTKIVTGAPQDNGGNGKVYLYEKNNNSTWESTELIANDANGLSNQGFSVDMSFDGNVVVVGGPNDSNEKGATWVWRKDTANQWQSKKLQFDSSGSSHQGHSVTINSQGNMIAIGAPMDDLSAGTVWICKYDETTSNWVQEQKLIPPSNKNGRIKCQLGYSVSLNGDGKFLIVGSPKLVSYNKDLNVVGEYGGIWHFKRTMLPTSNAVPNWINTLIYAEQDIAGGLQGYSCAISADGNTFAIGGPNFNNGEGATWIYTKLSGPLTSVKISEVGFKRQGESVSVSGDGKTLAVSGLNNNNPIILIYTKSDGEWWLREIFQESIVSTKAPSIKLNTESNVLVGGFYGNSINQYH